MSFSSYAEWVEMAYDPEDNIWYVERDSVIEKDGYIYWTEMVDWIKPNYGYKSTQGERQGDCENNRSKTLSITHFKEAMGNGETEVNTKDNPKWQDESSGSVAEIILNNLCEYVESIRPKVQEEPKLTYKERLAIWEKNNEAAEEETYKNPDGIFQCQMLANILLWEDEPHMSKGELKNFLFKRTGNKISFPTDSDSPFRGELSINFESEYLPYIVAEDSYRKVIFIYPYESDITPKHRVGKGIFKYSYLDYQSGYTDYFQQAIATCEPVKF